MAREKLAGVMKAPEIDMLVATLGDPRNLLSRKHVTVLYETHAALREEYGDAGVEAVMLGEASQFYEARIAVALRAAREKHPKLSLVVCKRRKVGMFVRQADYSDVMNMSGQMQSEAQQKVQQWSQANMLHAAMIAAKEGSKEQKKAAKAYADFMLNSMPKEDAIKEIGSRGSPNMIGWTGLPPSDNLFDYTIWLEVRTKPEATALLADTQPALYPDRFSKPAPPTLAEAIQERHEAVMLAKCKRATEGLTFNMGKPVKAGLMQKRGDKGFLKNPKPKLRDFILFDTGLLIYSVPVGPRKGLLQLTPGHIVSAGGSLPEQADLPNEPLFLISPPDSGRTYYFYAPDMQERDAWMAAITDVVFAIPAEQKSSIKDVLSPAASDDDSPSAPQ